MYEKIPAPVNDVLYELDTHGHRAFIVGGCVRDTLLGREPKDWDVATSATPDELLKIFPKCIPTGIKHGTVTVVSDGMHVEVTTFRSEAVYSDGRHPDEVEFKKEIEDDLARRDFTINAMAYSPVTDKLVDPYGGKWDLEGQTIRAVGDPTKRFGEDGLRTMRAIRFASQLGFQIEMETFLAIEPAIPIFRKVSMERVRDEFEKIVLSPGAERGIYHLAESKLGYEFLSSDGWWETLPFWKTPNPADLVTRLAVMFSRTSTPEVYLKKLKFPTKVVDGASHLAKVAYQVAEERSLLWHHSVGQTDSSSLRSWMSSVGKENVVRAVDVLETSLLIPTKVAREILVTLAFDPPLLTKELALNGSDVQRILDVKPGKLVGDAMAFLLRLVIDDPENNTPEELEAALREHALTLKSEICVP
jgi:tRNA nucleotidyltransferase (CCA-adding enzyme)